MAVQRIREGKHAKDSHRKQSASVNQYLRNVCKVYAFLFRRASTQNNFKIMRRLIASKRNKMPVSLAKVAAANQDGKINVIASTVTDDTRLFKCPKMTICALKFSETARDRITAAGGECLTFDQLAQADPMAANVTLIKSDPLKRHSQRYMGLAPGHRFSTTLERTNSKKNRCKDTIGKGDSARRIIVDGKRIVKGGKK